MEEQGSGPGLKRALGLWALVAFGVGDILGSGVYGLIGKIASSVGNAAWMSYVVAGIVAALTGLTYAEFTSRYPKAGGAAYFTQQAYRMPLITFMVIFFVALSGLFSVATTSRVFANYATAFLQSSAGASGSIRDLLQYYAVPLTFVLVVAFVTARGITLSSATNMVCSIVEVSALLIIIFLGLRFVGGINYLQFAVPSGEGWAASHSGVVLAGASIAFFAFIGFEDMSNLSEEAHNPERNVPLAICIAIIITSIIYCAIAIVAVSVVPPELLAEKVTKTPLIDVVRKASPSFPVQIFSVIPAFAVFNTALLNLMMASRLLFGMARGPGGQLPAALAYVHPTWRTPVIALAIATGVAMVMICSSRDVSTLAGGTTTFLLIVFALLHGGLFKLKIARSGSQPRFHIPIFVPVAGVLTCLALLFSRKAADYKVAGWLALAALVLFLINWFLFGKRHVEAVD